MLSGFLIGGILLDARDSPNYFKTFYLRRAYRILPLYGLILGVGWLTYQAGRSGLLHGEWPGLFVGSMPWWALLTFTQNFVMAFDDDFGGGSLRPTWSLAVEEQFYLTLPLLIRLTPRRWLLRIMLPALIVSAVLLRVFLMVHLPYGARASYFLMPTRTDALGMGVLAALLVRDPKNWRWLQDHRGWLYAGACCASLPLLLITLSSFDVSSAGLYGAEYTILAVFYTLLLLIAVSGEDVFVDKVFCNSGLMKLGVIAYGTYLLHRTIIHTASLSLNSIFGSRSALFFFSAMFLGLAVTVVVAQLSWTYFEKPLVRRGHHYTY